VRRKGGEENEHFIERFQSKGRRKERGPNGELRGEYRMGKKIRSRQKRKREYDSDEIEKLRKRKVRCGRTNGS